jgi:hypothetical protein
MSSRIAACAVVLLFLASPAIAEEPNGGNLLGQHGVLRLSAATPLPSGYLGIGTDFQYFKASGFLAQNQDHARMINTYAINWAPWRFFEVALALHVTSDNSTTTIGNSAAPNNRIEELQVAVGDPQLVIKGGAALGAGFALGGLLDLRFPSGAGFFQASGASTNVYFALLATWFGSRVPLGVHLNIGFLRDGSANLFERPQTLTPAQLYSAQVSSFNRVVTRLAVEYVTRYVGPFVELSLEPYVGSGAPGFGSSPGLLSIGLRGWPTRSRGLQLLAAIDIGITGVGDGTPITGAGQYAPVIPRWNLVLQASYRFDVFAKPALTAGRSLGEGPTSLPAAKAKVETGVIRGVVLDAKTDKPVWNARVTLEGQEASSLAVNPADGTFRSYRVLAGKHAITAVADGYAPARVEIEVAADGTAEAQLKLASRSSVVPGTLRGTVKAVTGKLRQATVLIPEVDQSIAVEADGSFTISLKPGEYKIVVSSKGLRTQTKSIRIQEGSTVILNVDLHR